MNIRINFKKILLIIGFLLISLAIGFLLYKMFVPNSQQIGLGSQAIKETDLFGSGLPQAEEGSGQIVDNLKSNRLEPDSTNDFNKPITPDQAGDILKQTRKRDNKITSVTEGLAMDASLSGDGSSINYYNAGDNKFYRITEDGQAVPLSDKKFYEVQKVNWSPTQTKAVMTYPDQSKIIYDFDTEQQVSLPKHWEEFDWSPSGDQLAFKSMGFDVDNRWLAIVNSDGTGSQTIEKIGKNADKIITSWSPNNQIIAIMTEGVDLERKMVYFIGLRGENFRSTITEGRGFNHKWAPKGDKLIYSVYSSATDYKPLLWKVDAQGDTIGASRLPLGLQTWANKCVFVDNDNLYCAVPKELEKGAGLFPDLANRTSDDLYYINISTGVKSKINNTGFYNMEDLIVTKDGQYLYFTDKLSGRLHRIEL